eukprot:CAMPEP_0184296994 /NCGR_PEP_ID=MMETSP1049-20130417/7937_1 /TAXON_ID=77928 /ORGANISM="Proteomonas sulcata, Strain CCMP704" /LENGTH=67 /DNA_ID=CAMNT_0026606509 /DNA_START=60 /DNA_END=260 /DNA_ORIENTATION=+
MTDATILDLYTPAGMNPAQAHGLLVEFLSWLVARAIFQLEVLTIFQLEVLTLIVVHRGRGQRQGLIT